ncbi:MAG: ComEA family DNA-binding protein, partial [Chloroflexia bacterium]
APPAAAVIVYTPTPLPTDLPRPTATPPPIVVYVSGAVRHPGVYALPAGARLADAVAAAGGADPQADLDQINLARRLQDEEHVHIPRRGETPRPEPTSPPAGVTPSGASGGKVNINTAGLEELDRLPGIGPGYAQRIIEYRQAHGPFASIEEIQNVPGIGPATFARIRDLITVQ